MSTCSKCGFELEESAKFCSQCGKPVEYGSINNLTKAKFEENRSKNRGSPKIVPWILFVLVLVITLLTILVNRKDEKQVSKYHHSSYSSGSADVNHTISQQKSTKYVYSKLNIRSGRGTNYKITSTLNRGDVVKISDVIDSWGKVYLDDVEIGFVFAPLLKDGPIPAIEIVDWNWRSDPDFGGDGIIKYTVELRNNTTRYIESVRVEITTYDNQGRLVASDFTYVNTLRPGEKASESSFAPYYGTEETARIRIASFN